MHVNRIAGEINPGTTLRGGTSVFLFISYFDKEYNQIKLPTQADENF